MDTYANRANTVFCTFVGSLFVAAVANHLTSYISPASPTCSIDLTNVFDLTVNSYLKADQANVGFSLQTDLSSAFQWNTKQLFVYVVASYQTQKNSRNEVVLWDDIIVGKEDAKRITSEVNEYPLRDQFRLLKSRNVTVAFHYRYMPIVGFMREVFVNKTSFITPAEYFVYKSGGSSSSR